MPRHAPELECSIEDKASLLALVKSRTAEARAVERARIILACLEGKEIQQVRTEDLRPLRFQMARALRGTAVCGLQPALWSIGMRSPRSVFYPTAWISTTRPPAPLLTSPIGSTPVQTFLNGVSLGSWRQIERSLGGH
jgi:hypothetical protein